MKISAFENIFEKNKNYSENKKNYLRDTTNRAFTRTLKESYKCTTAYELSRLLDATGYMRGGIAFPDYIMDGLSRGMVPDVAESLSCFLGYTVDPNPNFCSCERVYTKALYNNRNHRFSVYYKNIMGEIQKELKVYKMRFDQNTYRRYKACLIIFKVFFRVFYFKALPKTLKAEVYELCVSEHSDFADAYRFDEVNNIYHRKRFIRRSALIFNDGVAWRLVYDELHRFGLVSD